MTVEYIRCRVPGDATAFEEACARAAHLLAKAPQCADYELSRCAGSYLLRITWTAAPPAEDLLAELGPYVEERRRYEPTSVRGSGASVPTMHEWAGGTGALERLTQRFYEKVVVDEVVGPLFANMDPSHPKHVAMWLAEVFGGPSRYTAERGGYPAMLGHHLGKAITEAQRRRWVNLLVDAADDVGLPDDPEFRAAFMGYIEWGTRLALANSQPGATPPRRAPVPHWGWGVAPPYRP